MFDLLSYLESLPSEFPGILRVSPDIANLMACRHFAQFCSTVRSLVDPNVHCPFCRRERLRRKRRYIAAYGRWGLLENEFPHNGTEKMLLIVSEDHVIDPSSMSRGDWANVGWLFEHAREKCEIPDGILFLRYGDARYNASSIVHLHFNVIRPTPGKGFRPPAAKTEEKHAEDYARMRDYWKTVHERGGSNWLFSHEGIAETQP